MTAVERQRLKAMLAAVADDARVPPSCVATLLRELDATPELVAIARELTSTSTRARELGPVWELLVNDAPPPPPLRVVR